MATNVAPLDPISSLDSEQEERGWGARRAKSNREGKLAMAEYCIEHDFLVRESKAPLATASPTVRDTVASILVNQGTTPNVVVQQALTWLKTHWKLGPHRHHLVHDRRYW